MLGTEPQIIETYVNSGQIKIVFWPVLNHGNPSVYSTLTAECMGQQNPDLFWTAHKYLFEHQDDLWGAGRDYFVSTAVGLGADQVQFEACYDGTDGLATIMELDELRRSEWSVYSQPTFDINGSRFFGALPFTDFQEIIEYSVNYEN